jgi:hypothetical protein
VKKRGVPRGVSILTRGHRFLAYTCANVSVRRGEQVLLIAARAGENEARLQGVLYCRAGGGDADDLRALREIYFSRSILAITRTQLLHEAPHGIASCARSAVAGLG